MSINSSLIKLANKIDTDGVSEITPDYKNPNNSIEKSIERIADNYESGGGGGSSLPAVTPEDEGKVLTVDSEGEWVAGTGGGTGGGVFVAKINPDTGALDKTWQEVLDASFCQIIVDSGAEGKDYLHILSIYVDNGYKIDALLGSGALMTFTAASASDYPVANMG